MLVSDSLNCKISRSSSLTLSLAVVTDGSNGGGISSRLICWSISWFDWSSSDGIMVVLRHDGELFLIDVYFDNNHDMTGNVQQSKDTR